MPTSILIIGGGLIGLSVACAAARNGHSIHLIEPDFPPRGASWGNAGHIAVEQVSPLASMATVRSFPHRLYWRGGPLALPPDSISAWLPFTLRLLRASMPARHRHGKAVLKAMLADAMPAWERLAASAGLSSLIRQSGHYILWETPQSAAKGQRAWLEADSGTARFRPATAEETARLAALINKPPAGALFCEGSGQISDLGLLAEGLRAFLIRSGARIEQARVTHLETDQQQAYAVLQNGHVIRAQSIIITAGARSGDLLRPLGHAVPIIDERGYHIQAPVDEDRWPENMPPVVFEDRSMIVTRFENDLRAASFVEYSRADTPPDPSKWERLHHHADALGLPIGVNAEPWCGSRPTLPDYLPAIGRSHLASNLYYAFGHQHLGLTLAATTAEKMVGILGGESPDPALSLARFD